MTLSEQDIIRLVVAVLIGALIGFEREMNAKTAGLRTLTLITVGATLFTILSLRLGGDTTRVASNIVTGVGFLGAGAILLSEGRIRGLTTASSIWVAAALGMAVGIGEFALAGAATAIILTVLWLFARFDLLIDVLGREFRTYDITYNPSPGKYEQIEQTIKACGLVIVTRRRLKLGEALFQGEWEVRGPLARHHHLVDALLADHEVVEVKY